MCIVFVIVRYGAEHLCSNTQGRPYTGSCYHPTKFAPHGISRRSTRLLRSRPHSLRLPPVNFAVRRGSKDARFWKRLNRDSFRQSLLNSQLCDSADALSTMSPAALFSTCTTEPCAESLTNISQSKTFLPRIDH